MVSMRTRSGVKSCVPVIRRNCGEGQVKIRIGLIYIQFKILEYKICTK